MPLSFINQGTSATPDLNSTTDGTSFVTGSWTPTGSGLLMAFVFNQAATAGATVVPTVTGNSLTFQQIATVISGVNRLTLFAANMQDATTGTVTFDYGANTQLCCRASFSRATGAHLAPDAAGAIVQAVTASGAAALTGTVTLAAFASNRNRCVAGFAHMANEVTTPRINWTEFDDLAGLTPDSALETQRRANAFEATASADWTTSADWLGIAAEIKCGQSMPPVLLPLRIWTLRR